MGHDLQGSIAGGMTVGVIDVLKVIDINEEHTKAKTAATISVDARFELMGQGATIGHPCQLIAGR